MRKIIINRVGIRYGHLIVISFAGRDWNGHNWFTLWLCKCDCGNEIIVSGGNLQSGNVKSCGCFQREKSREKGEKRVGKNNPHYLNGKSCGKFTKTILKLKEKIRKQDNYTCQDCSIIQEEYKKKCNKKLDVHHIDGDDTNNTEENMITLCRLCHKYWENKFKRMGIKIKRRQT